MQLAAIGFDRGEALILGGDSRLIRAKMPRLFRHAILLIFFGKKKSNLSGFFVGRMRSRHIPTLARDNSGNGWPYLIRPEN
jgi:hypothetical protein